MRVIGYFSCLLSMFIINSAAHGFDLALKDENLQNCILQLAQQKQWSTVQAITEIECHNKNIHSLSGIEVFTQLQKLSLYNNDITEAKLPSLPNLQHLNLAKNKMDDLDVSGLPALEDMYVFGNKLKHLQLSALPKLKQLKANDNIIVDFHYQGLPVLEKI